MKLKPSGGCRTFLAAFVATLASVAQLFAANAVITWDNPADIVYGTGLSNSQLNAAFTNSDTGAQLTGTVTYTPSVGTYLNAGSQQSLKVTFTPNGGQSVGGGSVDKTVFVNVSQAALTATAPSGTPEYGTGVAAFKAALKADDVTYTGFVSNGVITDSKASLSVVPTLKLEADATTKAGSSKPVLFDVKPLASNYSITTENGTMTVSKKALVFTLADFKKEYGEIPIASDVNIVGAGGGAFGAPAPASGTGIGWQGNDKDNVTISQLHSVKVDSPVGDYNITVDLTQVEEGVLDNYDVHINDGSYTVNKRTLTISVTPGGGSAILYGGDFPNFGASFSIDEGGSAFSIADAAKNGDALKTARGVLDVAETLNLPATNSNASADAYDVTSSGGSAFGGNYNIVRIKGSLTVNKAPLTIKALDRTKIPGAALPSIASLQISFPDPSQLKFDDVASGIIDPYPPKLKYSANAYLAPLSPNLSDGPSLKVGTYADAIEFDGAPTTTNYALTLDKGDLLVSIPTVSILMAPASGIAGTEVSIPFTVKNFEAISGFQFSLTWNPEVVQLVMDESDSSKVKLSQVVLISQSGVDFPMINSSQLEWKGPGLLAGLWDEGFIPDIGRTLTDDTVLFTLHFQLVGKPGTSTTLEVVNNPTLFKIVPASNQDVFEVAPPASIDVLDAIDVSGQVTLFGDGITPIPGATVTVQVGSKSYETTTDNDGQYVMTVLRGVDYAFSASLAVDNYANKGVDVTDIIKLRKHILDREKLSSSVSWVAADPIRDNSIDVADIVGMRKVILNLTNYYGNDTNGNPADVFRFMNVNFKDVTAAQSFSALVEASVIGFSGTIGNLENVDFAGVKLGDANGDWEPAASSSTTLQAMPTGARLGQPMADAFFGFGASEVAKDGSLSLPLYAMANEPLMGVQFELNWDGAVMALDGVSSTSLSGFNPEFHASVGEGIAKVAWDDALLNGVRVDDAQPLLTLRFSRLSQGATGLELEAPVMAGEQGSVGWVQPASVYLKPDNTSQSAYSGAIKAIDMQDGQLKLLVDTQAGQSYELQHTGHLEQAKWTSVVELEGDGTWQEVVVPSDAASAYLRLVPIDANSF